MTSAFRSAVLVYLCAACGEPPAQPSSETPTGPELSIAERCVTEGKLGELALPATDWTGPWPGYSNMLGDVAGTVRVPKDVPGADAITSVSIAYERYGFTGLTIDGVIEDGEDV